MALPRDRRVCKMTILRKFRLQMTAQSLKVESSLPSTYHQAATKVLWDSHSARATDRTPGSTYSTSITKSCTWACLPAHFLTAKHCNLYLLKTWSESGQLHLGSRSLSFDSDILDTPLHKVRFNQQVSLEQIPGDLIAQFFTSSSKVQQNFFSLKSKHSFQTLPLEDKNSRGSTAKKGMRGATPQKGGMQKVFESPST